MKIWDDKEVLQLFKDVEVCKASQQPLKKAFANHAIKYKRKANSVRNYYYHEVDNLKDNTARCHQLGIVISNHIKNQFVSFEKNEENDLIRKIDELTKQGLSVRSACLKLSGQDLELMTRYQNKYQNTKKKEQSEKNDNIIPFKQRQKLLTESDITSLFMGLVKLIKKTAIEDYSEKMKTEKESSTFLLKKAFLDLGKKEQQISKLKQDFEVLKNENQTLLLKLDKGINNKKEALRDHLLKKQNLSKIESLK